MRKKIRKRLQLQLKNQMLMLSKPLPVLLKLLLKLQKFQSQVFQSCNNKINSNQLLNPKKKRLQNQKKKLNLHQRLLHLLHNQLQLKLQLNNHNHKLNHLKNLKSQLQQPRLLQNKLKQGNRLNIKCNEIKIGNKERVTYLGAEIDQYLNGEDMAKKQQGKIYLP